MNRLRTVSLSRRAADLILAESAMWHPLETGGVLIGRWSGHQVGIVEAIGPGPCAEHEAARFVRDGNYAQAQLELCHARSGGTLDYLGEWHSHTAPVGPGPRDRASMYWISDNPAYACTRPLLIICRLEQSAGWRLYGYQWVGMLLVKVAVGVARQLA